MSSGPTIAAAVAPATPASTPHNGGFLSSVNAIPGVSTLEHGAHVVEHGIGVGLSKTADVTASIGTGTYNYFKAAVAPGLHPSWAKVGDEYLQFFRDPVGEAKQEYQTDPFVKMNVQSVAPLAHPLRDPVQAALAFGFLVLPAAVSGAARVAYVARVARAAKVGDTGDLVVLGSKAADAATADGHTLTPLTTAEKADLVAKAANPKYRPPMPTRFLQKPVTRVVDAGDGTQVLEHSTVPVQLPTSDAPLARAGQALIDKGLQAGLTRDIPGLSRIANLRVGGTTDELARISLETKQALETGLQRSSRLFGRGFDNGVSQKMGSLAILLRSAQGLPEDAVKLWLGGAPTITQRRWADVAQSLIDHGVLAHDAEGRVVIDAAKFPKLAAADDLVRQAQHAGEGIVEAHALMTPEGQQTRLDLIGRVLAGAKWGVPAPIAATADHLGLTVNPAGKRYALGKLAHIDEAGVAAVVHPKWGLKNVPLDQLEVRFKGGLRGGEPAPQGEGFVSLRTHARPSPRNVVAAARSSVIPQAQKVSLGKEATGEGFRAAIFPKDVIRGVASHLHDLLRYDSTVKLREQAWELGSDMRLSMNEILVRDPFGSGDAEIPLDIQEELGRLKNLTDTERAGTEMGLHAAIEDRLAVDFPGRAPASELGQIERSAEPGADSFVPGYRWVPRQMVPASIRKPAVARSALGNIADNVNAAVTAATVYTRVGHIPTRLLTNATTNLIQGSLSPFEMRASRQLWGKLTAQERREMVGMTGPGGYRGVLPSEVQMASAVGRGASRAGEAFHSGVGRSANWWHEHVDSWFRFNSVAFRLREHGLLSTPADARKVIAFAKNPTRAADSQWASKVQRALYDGRRDAITYDGLNSFERRYVARLLWFFAWSKGATRFAFRTMFEHPVKSFAIASAGVQGSRERQQALGDVPGYGLDLTPLTGGANPLTANFSSYTPFSTLGASAEAIQHPLNSDTGLLGQANPAVGGLVALLQGKNALGAVGKTLSSTPEAQLLTPPPHATSVFGDTITGHHTLSELLRALGGAGVARPASKANLNTQAARDRAKTRTIRIPAG